MFWGKCAFRKNNFMCLVSFVLYIDVLSVSISSDVFFCIYEHVLKHVFASFSSISKTLKLSCKTNYIKVERLITVSYEIKYKIIFEIRQTTAMNIPQQRQQPQQRCPSWLGRRRPGGTLFIAVVCLMLYMILYLI